MNVLIVQIGPDEWADWRHVRIRALTENPEAFASSVTLWTGPRDTEGNWRERLSAPGSYFVAYDGEVPVGMVAASPNDDSVELFSMWVAPESRHRGIGGRLIAEVIECAGDKPVTLRVMDDNLAAIAAYESRGFVPDAGDADREGCRAMNRP
ncbi:MAG: GNAT family N-acetyltransferase [Aeromicrobium sp.]